MRRPPAVPVLLDGLVTVADLGLGWTWIVPAGLPLPLHPVRDVRR